MCYCWNNRTKRSDEDLETTETTPGTKQFAGSNIQLLPRLCDKRFLVKQKIKQKMMDADIEPEF